jgi:hypothetical protein
MPEGLGRARVSWHWLSAVAKGDASSSSFIIIFLAQFELSTRLSLMNAPLRSWAFFPVIFLRLAMFRAALRSGMNSREEPLPAIWTKLYFVGIYRPRFLGRHFVTCHRALLLMRRTTFLLCHMR